MLRILSTVKTCLSMHPSTSQLVACTMISISYSNHSKAISHLSYLVAIDFSLAGMQLLIKGCSYWGGGNPVKYYAHLYSVHT